MLLKADIFPLRKVFNLRNFIAAALLLLTFYVFFEILKHPFIYYDDEAYITRNTMVHQGLSWSVLKWAFSTFETGDWQPLVWISFILNSMFFGLNAAGFHATNLVLHSLNVLLVFYVTRRMTCKIWAAAFIAAFFAIHPLRVESVAWISERKDVLSGIFWWLTIGFYLEAKMSGKKVYENFVFLFYVLAILSKPIVITLPIILLLLDFWPLRRFENNSFLALAKEKIPLGMIALFSFVMAYIANGMTEGLASFEKISMQERLVNPLLSYWVYIKKTLWPSDLAIYYPFPSKEKLTAVLALCYLSGLIAVSVIAFKNRVKRPYLLVGWLWYLVILLPVIGFIPISLQALADRYTYLPHIGLGMFAMGLLSDMKPGLFKNILIGGCFAVILVWTFIAKRQVSYWVSPIALNEHAAKVIPNNYVAHGNLGYAYYKIGDVKRWEEHMREMMRIRPKSFFAASRFGAMLITQGRAKDAEQMYLHALALQPKSLVVLYNLGALHTLTGEYEKAEVYFREMLKIKSQSKNGRLGLAQLYIYQNRLDEAKVLLQEVLDRYPRNVVAHFQLGYLAELKGDLDRAVRYYEVGVKNNPPSVRALTRLGYVRSLQGRNEEAEHYLKRALEEQPYFENAYIYLGKMYYLEGRFDDAVTLLERGVALVPASKNLQKLYLLSVTEKNNRSAGVITPAAVKQNPFNVVSADDFQVLVQALAQQTSLAS